MEKSYYRQERSEIVDLVLDSTKCILDIGCGQGTFLKVLKEKTKAETWGVELVPEIAEVAKNYVDNVIVGKIEEIFHLIPDKYFDCITFNDVLEHLVEPTEVLKLIKPKLSDKGVIIASIPNVRFIVTLYDLIIKKDWEYKDAGILDRTHFRFFTKKSMKRMFEEAGYKIDSQYGINKINFKPFVIFNILTFGLFNDTQYHQFACIASKH